MLGIRRRIKRVLTTDRDRFVVEPSVTQRTSAVDVSNVVNGGGSFSKAARAASIGESPVIVKEEPSPSMGDPTYYGEVDNESAREKAEGKELDIDRDECIGCGTCVENTETVFFLNDDECKAYVIAQEGDMELVQDAIDACPVTCISWK